MSEAFLRFRSSFEKRSIISPPFSHFFLLSPLFRVFPIFRQSLGHSVSKPIWECHGCVNFKLKCKTSRSSWKLAMTRKCLYTWFEIDSDIMIQVALVLVGPEVVPWDRDWNPWHLTWTNGLKSRCQWVPADCLHCGGVPTRSQLPTGTGKALS